MVYVEVELDPEDIADAMNDDGMFMKKMLRVIAERVDAGLMRDNAADLAAQLQADEAVFLTHGLASLSEAIKSGFNSANHEQI